MTIDLVVWDYNGTLTYDLPRFTNAINICLKQWGVPLATEEEVACYDGDISSFYTRRKISLSLAEILHHVFETYSNLPDKVLLRDGAREALESIDVPQLLVTKHPTRLAEKEINIMGIRNHFDRVYTGVSDKAALLKSIVAQRGIAPQDVVMIGDMISDITAGKQVGSRTVGVSGYHPIHILEQHNPDYLIASLEEVPPLITDILRGKK